MANNRVQVKRTSTAGRTPNTTGSYATNTQYISAGELALNMADGILYTSNGSAIIEVGANNSNYNTNGNISLTTNGKSVKFATKNTSSYAYFSQQTDDNFVFYSTDTAYNPRAIWSVFANSASSNLNISVRTQFNGGLYIPPGVSLLDSTGSQGSAGQILASNGSSNVYWVTPGAASVNTAAQFTWTNTHTFQANVSFTGSGLAVNSNTGSVYFGGISDANWRISRNAGVTTKYFYTNNSLDIIAASSNKEGIVFGWTGNSYLETGYAGTFTTLPIYVGNSSVNTTINSTSFTGTSNNASYLGGVAAASYVQNTDSRTLSGNLTYTGANLVILGTNTYITSNVLINGVASFTSINGQANASAGAFVGNAYATLGGGGGNYLAFGQQTNFSQWIQSGYSGASPVYYNIILNPLGGNIGIGNTLPTDKLSVNGTTYLGANVNILGTVLLNGSNGTAGQVLTSNGSSNAYWSTISSGSVNTSAQYTWTNTHTFNSAIYANTVNASSFTVGTSTISNSTGVYTGVVNGSSITVGTLLIGNSTGVYHTGTVNAASHTIGTTFIANTTGTYHTGTVNAASHTVGTSTIANSTGVYSGVVNATTISTGSVNVINASGLTTTANVNIGAAGDLIVTAGAGIYANGGLGTAGQVLTSNASSIYWSTISGGTGATLNANNTDTATYYFGMANTSSGSWSNAVVSTTKISFVPNTGALTVNGSISATTKSFLIAHPTKPGMMLRYASLEGPENGVYVRGRIDGTNVIELPDYWEGLVDFDTITVNLTSIGHAQNLYVAAIDGLKIHIDTENHTQPYFYYHVYAERKDVEKLVVEY